MLFILTGTFQTGKTRWLQVLIERLQRVDVPVFGVVAPGRWIDHGEAAFEQETAPERFEKTGIDNILLPQGEVINFACRPDLVVSPTSDSTHQQAAQAKLGWAIADAALDQVNAHFCSLCAQARDCTLPDAVKQGAGITAYAPAHAGLLVIDELGPLELLKNGGLTSAMDVLAQGPSPLAAHALIVVRESLLELAMQRFETCWGGAQAIYPTEACAQQVFAAFGL